MKEIGITRGNFGGTYRFILKNVQYGGGSYGAKIYVQSPNGTLIVNGTDCTLSATDSNKHTLVEYTPASGQFGVSASTIDYLAEIEVSAAGFRDSSETFLWQVHDELRG